jgi:tetratricopeptide (TPR) repeat protein
MGLYREALEVVTLALNSEHPSLRSYPILHYYAGWLNEKLGDLNLASTCYASAAAAPTDYAFPFRFETLEVLKSALQKNPDDSRAWYYMGNILYDHQPDLAISCWEKSVEMDPKLAIACRNLGWGYYRWKEDLSGAIAWYEKAMAINQNDPRYYYELDVLYEMNNENLGNRLRLFSSNPEVVKQRNDAYLREIEVLLLNGKYDSALSRLSTHTFLRQEGVVQLHDYFVDAHLLKGRELLQLGAVDEALKHFQLADSYPDNQKIGRISHYPKEAQIYYFTGMAFLANKEKKKARYYFQQAAKVQVDQSEYLYYRALSQKALGLDEEARETATALLRSGEAALEKAGESDFFAKFGEQAGGDQRTAAAYSKLALGYQSVGEAAKAREALESALALHNSLLWAKVYLDNSD